MARIVSAAVKSAPVNDPKKVGRPGAQVRMIAPKKSGTIIMPPGIRSIVRLMGICTMAVLASASLDVPTAAARHAAPCRATLQASETGPRRTRARGGRRAQEQAVDVRDRLPGRRPGCRRRVLVARAGARGQADAGRGH